ncbi:MAG: glycoside hydrolase family 127 protein [Clostridia bacterium]|nr:glycoside hydrolase family 127 protein [Clostridia bacterium]
MKPLTKPLYRATYGGDAAVLAKRISANWLIGLRESNPALLDMFVYDDDKCVRDKLSWSGEFPGKYLASCCGIYRLTGEKKLLSYAVKVADELISYQKENGYIGVWGNEYQLTGSGRFVIGDSIEVLKDTWDCWSLYHVMFGLLRLYTVTKDEKYFISVKKAADLFCRRFYGKNGLRLADTGCLFANLAPIHIMALLYNICGDREYLDFALEAEKDVAHPDAVNFINNSLAGNEFYKCRGVPRWEYLHSVEALAELYYATGDEKYKNAFVQIWNSIQKTDVHNTGAFSTFEQAMGTPYIYDKAIETCCVVAHTALTVDMLALTNDFTAADQLEKSLYNTTFGSFNPTGRWSTYNTPMMGYKRAHYHEIAFQCKPGAPELNCCSVNAPRPLGELAEWAYRTNGNGVYINYYGNSSAEYGGMRITQTTLYPYADTVNINITGKGNIFLRIPAWSEKTRATVNGRSYSPESGYFAVECSEITEIKIKFDFSPRVECGAEQLDGKRCVYIGPMLLCYDKYYTQGSPDAVFGKDFTVSVRRKKPGALYDISTAKGNVTLCDMILAGSSGSYYTTWL